MGRRKVGSISGFWAFLILVVAFSAGLNVRLARGSGTIYIKADGSIDPPWAPIRTDDNITYTFQEDIYDPIVVERDNIIVDGASCWVRGTMVTWSKGIDLSGRTNATISNMGIEKFSYGIFLHGSSNCSISESNLTNNANGIHLQSSSNYTSISGNTISKASTGIGLRYFSNYNNISGNQIVDNSPLGTGIIVEESSYNSIAENNIANNGYGVQIVGDCRYNVVSGNNVTANFFDGIVFSGGVRSTHNRIVGNNVKNNNQYGILVQNTVNLTLRNNTMVNNKYNFGFWGAEWTILGWVNDIDTSNTVDGKPIYYWINQREKAVPTNAGYVVLVNCTGITIQNLSLVKNGQPMVLAFSTNTTIAWNYIANNIQGIISGFSSNVSIVGNTITANDAEGMALAFEGSNHRISGNNITNNNLAGGIDRAGIHLYGSMSTISENNIINNGQYGILLEEFSNGSIVGNNIANNLYGINGVSFSVSIAGNNITTNNLYGINLYGSNTSIYENSITNNGGCISLGGIGNSVYRNNITTNNAYGISLDGSLNSTVSENTIFNNFVGIELFESYNNSIYHNNFLGNTYQVYDFSWEDPGIPSSINIWDDGYPSGGNYWSDYAGVDQKSGPNQDQTRSDGIGDTPYIIDGNNEDRYPLTAPISPLNVGTWNAVTYKVSVASNSTVSAFYFNPEEGAFLRFNVTGESGTNGFCRVAIPKDLLWVEDGWIVLVGSEPVDYTISEDANYTYLYFTYSHSTKTIQIIGTNVIIEFPPATILPLLMILTLLAIVFAKRRFPRKLRT